MLVPWVAMWTSEKIIYAATLTPYGVETGVCDTNGVHWIQYGNSPGVGEPLFGQVHTARQVECMRKPRCQVCGKKMARSPCYWILNKLEAVLVGEKTIKTQTPPVCYNCIKVALDNCPHLQSMEKVPVLKVTKYSCIGPSGDFVLPSGERQKGTHVDYGHPDLKYLVGRQLWVELKEYTVVQGVIF